MSRARDFADLAGAADAGGLTGRNLIINGAMQVAQRGTSGTSTADIYTVDRFAVGHGSPVNAMTFEQSTDTPDNFKNSLKVTAGTGASAGTTGYATLRQAIEGQNMAHLGFGTSAAKAITLSFYVKCSLTGTFGISIRNQAGDRAYAGTYVINSANTWEYKTVAIPGDASGTWPTDTGLGFNLFWDLGAGSNYDIAAGSWTTGSNMFGVESTVKLTETTGATFFITGIQLEVGETATPFEHRSFADELRRCQRYYEKSYAQGTNPGTGTAVNLIGTAGAQGNTTTGELAGGKVRYMVTKRATPTIAVYDEAGTSAKCKRINYGVTATNGNGVVALNVGDTSFDVVSYSGLDASGLLFHFTADAEL